MRTRAEILKDYHYYTHYLTGQQDNDVLASIANNQRLLLEVLLDIRDEVKKVPGSS